MVRYLKPDFLENLSEECALISEGRSQGAWMDQSSFIHQFEHPCCFDERSFLPIWSLRHGILRVPKLAAPQHVSCFGVCLDLHRNAPFLEFLPSCFTSGDSNSMKPLKLPAPHRVSSFRVRLDLHRNAPFLGFLPPWPLLTSGDSDSMKPLKLAAPHRVSSFRVRLDLHRDAPFLGFLLPWSLLTSRDSHSMGKPQVSCPTSRFQLSCSSLPSSECPFPWNSCQSRLPLGIQTS